MPEPNSGCWLWCACVNRTGYGQMALGTRDEKRALAHRVAWMLYRGALPSGALVCHRCDNPACVNPDHLFLGDQRENMRDCSRKGRVNRAVKVRGTSHPNAKLTPEQVRLIRSTRRQTARLAAQLGVSTTVVKLVRQGASYRSIM
jgi:hypothetical protein